MTRHRPNGRCGILQTPQGKSSVAIAIASLLPATVLAAIPHTHATTLARSETTRGSSWNIMWSILQAIEKSLNDPDYAVPPDTDSEQANLDKAAGQMDRYMLAGALKPATAQEAAEWVQEIDAARRTILGDPAQFTDPVWGAFLDYLDRLEADVRP